MQSYMKKEADNGMMVPINWKKIATETKIKEEVKEFAHTVSQKFKEVNDIVIVCILKGAVYFFVEFTQAFSIPHSTYFLECSSYGDKKQQGNIEILSKIVPSKFQGKTVILIDELYDNGTTMNYVKQGIHKEAQVPLEDIYTCAFMKKDKKNAQPGLDMFALRVPDVWLVGYGLDHQQQFRNLTDLWAVPKEKEEEKTEGDREVFG